MGDGLSRIVAPDSWGSQERLGAGRTGVVQAHHSREQSVEVVDDEHDMLPLSRSDHAGAGFFRKEEVPHTYPLVSKYVLMEHTAMKPGYLGVRRGVPLFAEGNVATRCLANLLITRVTASTNSACHTTDPGG